MESRESRIKDIHDNIKVFDFIVIKDTLNVARPAQEKVIDINSSYIYTLEKVFIKKNLRCVTLSKENLYIEDYIPNDTLRICNFLQNKGYSIDFKDNKRLLKNNINNIPVKIILDFTLKNKINNIKVVIKLKEQLFFSGYIKNSDLFEQIYESIVINNVKYELF